MKATITREVPKNVENSSVMELLLGAIGVLGSPIKQTRGRTITITLKVVDGEAEEK